RAIGQELLPKQIVPSKQGARRRSAPSRTSANGRRRSERQLLEKAPDTRSTSGPQGGPRWLANVRLLFHLAERHCRRSVQLRPFRRSMSSVPCRTFTKLAQS